MASTSTEAPSNTNPDNEMVLSLDVTLPSAMPVDDGKPGQNRTLEEEGEEEQEMSIVAMELSIVETADPSDTKGKRKAPSTDLDSQRDRQRHCLPGPNQSEIDKERKERRKLEQNIAVLKKENEKFKNRERLHQSDLELAEKMLEQTGLQSLGHEHLVQLQSKFTYQDSTIKQLALEKERLELLVSAAQSEKDRAAQQAHDFYQHGKEITEAANSFLNERERENFLLCEEVNMFKNQLNEARREQEQLNNEIQSLRNSRRRRGRRSPQPDEPINGTDADIDEPSSSSSPTATSSTPAGPAPPLHGQPSPSIPTAAPTPSTGPVPSSSDTPSRTSSARTPDQSSSNPPRASSSTTSSTSSSTSPPQPNPSLLSDHDLFFQAAQAFFQSHFNGQSAVPPPQGSQPATPAPQAHSQPKKRKVHTPRLGSARYKAIVKQQAKQNLGDANASEWAALMRDIYASCTGMPYLTRFESYTPIDEETIENFRKGGPGPVGPNRFRFYFGPSYATSNWNRRVFRDMASLVPAKQAERGLVGYLTTEAAESWFHSFLVQSQKSWSAGRPRIHPSGTRYETNAEANARCAEYTKKRERDVKRSGYKLAKLEKRRKGIASLLKDPRNSAQQKRNLEMLSAVVEELDMEGQSSEYSDVEAPYGPDGTRPLKTRVPYYRRRAIGDALKDLDYSIRVKRITGAAQGTNSNVRPSRIRDSSNIISTRKNIKSLPKSFYHKRLLRRLEKTDRLALEDLDVDEKQIPHFDHWAAAQGASTSEGETDDMELSE